MASYYKPLCHLISQGLVSYPPPEWNLPEWESVLALAHSQGVAALLYWRLQNAPHTRLPDLINTLAPAYYNNLAQHALYMDTLAVVLGAMEMAGIHPTLLKGADLAYRFYQDPALRPLADIDLLVSPAEVGKATQTLQRLGYDLQKMTYHAVFAGGPGNRVLIELHWGLATSPTHRNLPARAWFDSQVEPYIFPFGKALVLRAEANILYLSAHLSLQHRGITSRLIWYYDLLLLLERFGENLDWSLLHQYSVDLGWKSALSYALTGVAQRFSHVIPEPVLWWINHASTANQIDQISNPIENWIIQALHELDWPTRIQMLWYFLFPSSAYLSWRYRPQPAWLWPVYYPVRWVNILQKRETTR